MFYSYSSFGNKIRFSYFFLGTVAVSTLTFMICDLSIKDLFLTVLFSFCAFLIMGGLIWCAFVSCLNDDVKEYTSEGYGSTYYGLYYKKWRTLFGKKFAYENYQFYENLFEQKKQQVIDLDNKEVYIKDGKLYIK